MLPFFDAAVHELFHPAAVDTHDMIVVCALIQLEYRHAAFEMVARNQSGGFELSQNPIHRGETNILVGYQQLFINVLCAHMTGGAVRENVEDFQTRQRNLEARIAQVVAFIGGRWFEAVRHDVQPGMIGPDYQSFNGSATILMKIFQRLLLGSAVSFLATACVYRINIQQGNFLDQAAVEQVKAGMTRSQVRYLLGTPMVADSFNKERWDYIYYLKKGRTRHVDSRRVTVYFDGEKVAKLDKPTAAEAAAQDKSAAQLKKGRTY